MVDGVKLPHLESSKSTKMYTTPTTERDYLNRMQEVVVLNKIYEKEQLQKEELEIDYFVNERKLEELKKTLTTLETKNEILESSLQNIEY